MDINAIKALIPAWILNSQNLLLNITDLEGKYIFVNDLFKERFSFLQTGFIGLPFNVALHQEDAEKCNQIAYHCITHPDDVVEVMLRKPDTDEEKFYWTKWEFSLFKDKNGQPAGILCIGYDITETTRASELALEFTEKTEKIIENITDGFYVLDKDWRFIKLNKVTSQIWGIPEEKLLGKVLWEVFPDDGNRFNYPNEFRRAIKENVTVNFEDYRTNLKQWFKITAYPSPEGLTVFFRDITFERQAQQELIDSQTKLKAILDSTTDINLLIGKNYELLSHNRQAAEYAEQFLEKQLKEGVSIKDIIPLDIMGDFEANFCKALQGAVINLEREIIFSNGKVIWFDITYYPAYNDNQELMGISFNLKNITPRKNTEQELKKTEYLLNAIYNSISEACAFINPEGKILYLNKVANNFIYNIFGKYAQLNEDYLDYVLPGLKEGFKQNFQKALQGETVITEETDGIKWFQFTFFPVYDESGTLVGIAENVQDITQRKENELQILNQNEKLRAIAWHQAHEVRRPLANVLGLAILIKEEDSLELKNSYLELMLESIKQLDQAIHAIVKYSSK